MSTMNELGLESELEVLRNKSKVMKKKEMQMRKFLKTNTNSSEDIEQTNLKRQRQKEVQEINIILSEIEREKESKPEILEFYCFFEEMKNAFEECIRKENKVDQAFKEIFTGENN